MRRVLVLNGVNLGRLGTREPQVYGTTTHAELAALCVETGRELGLDVEVRQTDEEAQLVGWLHEAADATTPVVLNSAAWTHYSYALRDACAQLTAPLVEVRQTDDEAQLVGWLHEAADDGTPVVLNSAAWTHYSYALRDACAQLTAPLVEVHLSQIHAREAFRATSVVSPVATATLTGLGVEGYRAALRFLATTG